MRSTPACAAAAAPAASPCASPSAPLVGLVGLGIGLWVERLVTDLLSQGGPLQAATLALLAVAGAGILVWAGWELLALRRLGRVEEIRSQGRAAAGGDAAAADAVIARFRRLHSDGPAADGLARLERERDELRDPAELIALLELHAQRPIDAACRAAIAATARRTALITTVTPFAIVDMVVSGALNLRMIRRIAEIQGFRPGLFATLALIRRVATTLLIAGGIEAANDYLGDFLGAGLLRAFGRRAGEGAINGILSVRIGVATMKVCRPLPYLRDTPPGTDEPGQGDLRGGGRAEGEGLGRGPIDCHCERPKQGPPSAPILDARTTRADMTNQVGR